MASTSFRDSMNSLGWSRRDADVSVSTAPTNSFFGNLSNLNPFGGRGYVRLPTTENPGAPLPAPTRREEEEGWFALSRWDRLLVFGGLNLAAAALFAIAIALMMTVGFVVPRKFAILWTLASILFLSSWAVLMGPWTYLQHLMSGPRLPFTAAYFGSIALTLYFSLGLKSTLLTLFSAVVQLICLVWYLVSYFPMGSTGLRFAARFGGNRITAWMND